MLHATILLCVMGSDLQVDRDLADKWLSARQEAIGRLQDSRSDRVTRVDPRRRFANRKSAGTTTDKADLLRVSVPLPKLSYPLKVGDAGGLIGGEFRVLQRLSPNQARVGLYRSLTAGEAIRYIDRGIGSSASALDGLPTVDAYLEGFDISQTVDDQFVKTPRCFVVAGTKTYATALGGTRTVFVLRPYDESAAFLVYRRAVKQEVDGAEELRAEKERSLSKRLAQQAKAREEADARSQQAHLRAMLNNARRLAKARLYAPAESNLRKIMSEAPGSPIASEAEKEIASLPPH